MNLGYTFEISNNEDMTIDKIKDEVSNGDISSAIYLSKNNNSISMNYIVKNTSMFSPDNSAMVDTFTNLYKDVQISKSGLTDEQIAGLNANISFNLMETDSNAAKGNPIITMLMSIVLFYAIYFCAYQVSLSITTEKTSRIIETLVTSTKPRIIVLGKTIRNRNSWFNASSINYNRCTYIS